MTVVTGTEQRWYGTLVGNCQIYLDRFALVLGSESESPSTASSIVVGSDLSFYQCGFEHSGNFSLVYFLSLTAATCAAAFEARICKNDSKRIVIETYGDVATTQAMSLWFNTAKSAHKESSEPVWVKLNSVASGSTMTYATTSYIFKEDVSENRGSVVIDCCKKCPTCQCLNCYICDRLYLKAVGDETKIYGTSIKHGYGRNLGNSACIFKASGTIPITSFCPYSMTLDMSNYEFNLYFLDDNDDEQLIKTYTWYQSTAEYDLIVEYKIECDTVTIWSYLDDDVVSTDSNLIGKNITVSYVDETYVIESFDNDTNVLTVDETSIVLRETQFVDPYISNVFYLTDTAYLSQTNTKTFTGTDENMNFIRTDDYYSIYRPTGNLAVKIRFQFSHDGKIQTSGPPGTVEGMYMVQLRIGNPGSGSIYSKNVTGEDTKLIDETITFYGYQPYNDHFVGWSFGYELAYNYFLASTPVTVTGSVEILDVYDGCTGKSYMDKLPYFLTLGLQYPNQQSVSFTAAFSSLDATTNPVTTSTFDFDYPYNCVNGSYVIVVNNIVLSSGEETYTSNDLKSIQKCIDNGITIWFHESMSATLDKNYWMAQVSSVDIINKLIYLDVDTYINNGAWFGDDLNHIIYIDSCTLGPAYEHIAVASMRQTGLTLKFHMSGAVGSSYTVYMFVGGVYLANLYEEITYPNGGDNDFSCFMAYDNNFFYNNASTIYIGIRYATVTITDIRFEDPVGNILRSGTFKAIPYNLFYNGVQHWADARMYMNLSNTAYLDHK
jgi:hypothetical protein